MCSLYLCDTINTSTSCVTTRAWQHVRRWEGKEWTWTIRVLWNTICMLNREMHVSQPCTASASPHVLRNTETLPAPMCSLAGSLRVRPVWMSVNKLALQPEFKLAVLLKRDSTGKVRLRGPAVSGPCGSWSQKKALQLLFYTSYR